MKIILIFLVISIATSFFSRNYIRNNDKEKNLLYMRKRSLAFYIYVYSTFFTIILTIIAVIAAIIMFF